MTPQTTQSKQSTLQEILQAILAGLQIAAAALPVIGAYETQFGVGTGTPLAAPIAAQAAQAHPATGAVVSIMLAAPPTPAAPAAPTPTAA